MSEEEPFDQAKRKRTERRYEPRLDWSERLEAQGDVKKLVKWERIVERWDSGDVLVGTNCSIKGCRLR